MNSLNTSWCARLAPLLLLGAWAGGCASAVDEPMSDAADEGSIVLQFDDTSAPSGALRVSQGSVTPFEDGFVVEGLISSEEADLATESIAEVDKVASPPKCFKCYWCSGSQCWDCEPIPCPK